MAFEINKTYNFTTLAPAILGGTYKEVKVKSIMTSEEAIKYREINTLHNTLKPVINSLPDSVIDCTYVLFENKDKEKLLLAIEYIDPYSVIAVTSVNIRAEIHNVTSNDVAIIRSRLLELGYSNIVLKTF